MLSKTATVNAGVQSSVFTHNPQQQTIPRCLPTVTTCLNTRQPQAGIGRNIACRAVKSEYRQSLVQDPVLAEKTYLASRTQTVTQYFPYAMSVHDFMARLEIALHAYGFNGDNSIACANLCRDEITLTVKQEIDKVFGSTFNINGLGGVLTCGVTGIKAGLSHSPVCAQGKERYVFFSFPHISIDASGAVGAVSRPGRSGPSCACGALLASMAQIKAVGLEASCKRPGVHEPIDPELSILKQRLARRMRFESWSTRQVEEMDLVDITKVAERTISDDLEYLISKAVDVKKADYAVVTGVQIHNWGKEFDDDEPNFEFVAPTGVYAVIDGHKMYLDLDGIPSLTPRQVSSLHTGRPSRHMAGPEPVTNAVGITTLRSIDAPFLYSSQQEINAQKQRAEMYVELLEGKELPVVDDISWPLWKANLVSDSPAREEDGNSTQLDYVAQPGDELEEITTEFLERLRAIASEEPSTTR